MITTPDFLEWIRTSLEFSHDYMIDAVRDIPDSRLAEQPPGVPNHAAWTLGHLAVSMQMVGEELGMGCWLPEDWPSKFVKGGAPLPDRAAYPSKDALVSVLHDGQSRLLTRLAEGGESLLTTPLPSERVRSQLPTIGHCVVQIVIAHTAYHTGQLLVWRRALGLGTMARPYL